MFEQITDLIGKKTNFIFVGVAGSGKSEIAINFAKYLAHLGDKPVHFFDMDMTKPLFRSRDVIDEVERMGITFHHEVQFMDAPTMVGGVDNHMRDNNCYVVMDVGGDYIGARSIGGYAPGLNKNNTNVYYVLNAYRPWSDNIDHIDYTLGQILGVSHIQLGQIHMINNPNNGLTTTAEEFIEGCKKMSEIVSPYIAVDFACVKEDLYEQVREVCDVPLMPVHLYLTYEWLLTPDGQPMPGKG